MNYFINLSSSFRLSAVSIKTHQMPGKYKFASELNCTNVRGEFMFP